MSVRSRMLGLAVSVLTLGGFSACAIAGDLDAPPPATVFGNIHASGAYTYAASGGSTRTWPSANVGGKADYESANSPFGFQFDLDANGHSYSWDSPSVPYGGTRIDTVGALHGTYAINDVLKLGIFASLTNENESLTGITDTTYNFKGHTNLSSAGYSRTEGIVGTEALYMFQPDDWVQGHVGITKKLSAMANWTDATTSANTFANYTVNQDYGFQVGGGAHLGLTPNFSLRGDANLNVMLPNSGGYDDNLTAAVTGQYAFDDIPLAIYGQGSYEKFFTDTSNTDRFTVRTGLVLSFGGPTSTVRGKLFHSAGTTGTMN